MVMKAGSASDISSISILEIESIMKTPTRTKAPLVAALGISRNNGAKNNARINSKPVTRDVKPDRPPSAIPEALSTYVVMVELPIIAPIVVPIASDIIASFTCGICPSSPIIPVLEAKPTNVPTVSKIFMNNRVKITTAISNVKNSEKSNLQKVGSIE